MLPMWARFSNSGGGGKTFTSWIGSRSLKGNLSGCGTRRDARKPAAGYLPAHGRREASGAEGRRERAAGCRSGPGPAGALPVRRGRGGGGPGRGAAGDGAGSGAPARDAGRAVRAVAARDLRGVLAVPVGGMGSGGAGRGTRARLGAGAGVPPVEFGRGDVAAGR